jgi:HEAT repeat protein
MCLPGRLGETAGVALAAVVRRTGARDAFERVVGGRWPHEGDLARNLCRVAGVLADPRHASDMVSLLGSTDTDVRVAAAQALGSVHGDHEGASALAFALTDEEPAVRAAACRSLGALGAPLSVSALLSATSDGSPLVRASAVAALVSLDNPVALSRLRAVIVEDPVPAVVVQAIAGLGGSGLEQDLTMLMSLCTSDDWEVVKAAARALCKFRKHRATAALLGLLGHDRWDVRWAAAEVLAERGDATALVPLHAALDAEDDPLVRQILSDAVRKLESP